MRRRNHKQILFSACLLALFMSSFLAQGQSPGITGPECVRRGVEYQYIINANSTGHVQVCLSGGVFASTKLSCIRDTILTEVRVIWTDSIGGMLTILSGKDSYRKNISVAKELDAGTIAKELAIQRVKEGSVANEINYTGASGGSCNPKYVYQWQQSEDNLHWTDVEGTDRQKFSFSSASNRSLYFRRKVTDVNSGNFAYTEPVAVFIKPEKSTN